MNHGASQNQCTDSGADHAQSDMLKECGYLLGSQPIHQYGRLVHVRLAQLNEVSLRRVQFVARFSLAGSGGSFVIVVHFPGNVLVFCIHFK
jgi:hypothetical protein